MKIQSRLKGAAAPIALSLALLAQPALAQDDGSSSSSSGSSDENSTPTYTGADNVIVVTGSIVRNPAAATASPVVSVTSEDLDARGVSSIAEALQQLTANNAGTAQPSWSTLGFGTGASAPSLRGLNDAYTLTLFNGMRSALYPLADDGYRNFVDINSMPRSITERVDVLLDGASATYGSDAIAGVINVIPKREIQGLHMDASYGQTVKQGDAKEYRLSATYGYGDLDDQGFNIFINGEYQKNDRLWLTDRPQYNKSFFTDLSSICGTADQGCLYNLVQNGIQYDGSFSLGSTHAPLFRPLTNDFASDPVGPYQYGSAGCTDLPSHTLTQSEIDSASDPTILPPDGVVCQQDLSHFTYNSPTRRIGGNLKATFKVGDTAEAYFMFNYYNVTTKGSYTPYGYAGSTSPGGTRVGVSQIFLPVYVCPEGQGQILGGVLYAEGCDASNGTLNPSNPFASQGYMARLLGRPIISRGTDTDATTTRFMGGINGSFGSWNYNLNAVSSQVRLNRTQHGYIWLPGLLDAVATGSYNFQDPFSNTEAATQTLFPDNHNLSRSVTSQVILTIDRDFFDLPGGALNVAVSGQYRYEAVHNPSSNPPNEADPTQRYFSLNAVGVDGSRRVWSGAYEISAPITDMLRVKLDGSYDSYSTGQSKFSPKFEAEFKPIEELKLRGTYSKGFRVPSFSEAFALPTTGYVTGNIVCTNPTFQAFCAAHASNPGYYSGGYTYGLTSAGNASLSPEKAESFTLGAVFEPVHHTIFTVDYWQTKISNVIVPVSAGSSIINQYYTNNGVVDNVAGITVLPGVPDPQNPGALPVLGFIVGSYKNADNYLARGIDFSGSSRIRISDSLTLHSQLNASLLLKLQQVLADGTVQRYDGSLGQCGITACSGAPRWRLVWLNSLDIGEKASISLTGYYTSGYSEVATDSGGVYGDCQASTDNGQIVAWDNGDPVQCRAKASFDLDGHVQYKINDMFTVYGDMLNILNTGPHFEPNAAYGLYGFNPSWEDRQFIGRWFRVGVKVDM